MSRLKLLADLDFARILTEASKDVQTAAGQSLIRKYQQFLLVNECSYKTVNGFIAEARNCMFDNAVAGIAGTVCGYINDNKYSWQLASACESILNSSSKFDYLNKNACKQVEDLLEGKSEEDVVKYIKAGALKNVMFCEAFRGITKSIFKDIPLVESAPEYTAITPISFFESNNGKTFFEVLGMIFSIGENGILEENVNSVSNDFITVSRLLESNSIKYENDTFSVQVGNYVYEAKECDKCKKKKLNEKGEVVSEEEFNTAGLREHNEMYITALGQTRTTKANQFVLEAFAKLVENLDSISVLDNVRVIKSQKDSFIVIEHNGEIYTKSLNNTWGTKADVVEALKYIKDQTNIDLKEHYQEQIEKVVETKTAEEKQKVLESIHEDEMKARRERIEKLTEQYKNDPVKLAMLAKIAEDLNKLA